ncbi:MAG: pyruvate dehydrogenase [Candidatus Thorarchaeota archaeon]
MIEDYIDPEDLWLEDDEDDEKNNYWDEEEEEYIY